MADKVSRRDALKQMGAAGAGLMISGRMGGVLRGQSTDIVIAGQPVEIAVTSLSATTVRITVRQIQNGAPTAIPVTGALVQEEFGAAAAKARAASALSSVRAGNLVVSLMRDRPELHITSAPATGTARAVLHQKLTFDPANPGMTFLLPQGPLLGLGEGGPQFDRKGSVDTMRNGQGGFQLATHGTRAPIQWLVGTDGWAMFIHQPYGQFDFTGVEGKFNPPAATALPLDVFVVVSKDPKVIMREYARISGLPEMPAMWTFGYQQSHRTLNGAAEIVAEAKLFREKKLPCDTMIYLGTEFAPSGWNTRNGEFTWHPTNFPDPKKVIDELHAEHMKVVVHVVIEGRRLLGKVDDPCTADPLPSGRTADDRWPPDRQVSCYWPVHKTAMDMGVDGWWPDQGDGLDGPSRLNRHRMYWEGTQQLRPNERPFALHRNASAGIQRFGGFIWSGDVQGRWETLKNHIPIAVNTGLSGLPYWGTDIGGFNPTADYTGELHTRWFQFAAFCPSFRAHGRNWHLKLPWGWNGGDGGPFEAGQFRVPPDELKNASVEPILKKYLELRYQLMPYLYTAVRETHETGLPIMRALWLHDATDPIAAARGDAFLFGPDILVAPVVEKGATSRKLYLPKGTWIDYWTEEKIAGGREIDKAVDLSITPLYVRAGAVIPVGPIKQYTAEPTTEPTTLVIYPGANGTSFLYEDDGKSFDYRKGEYMKIAMRWTDATRTLALSLVTGSRMRAPNPRKFNVRVAGSKDTKSVAFAGRPVSVRI
jgi:alpha-glucosidase (family GH31 glycosyl hydrolase)